MWNIYSQDISNEGLGINVYTVVHRSSNMMFLFYFILVGRLVLAFFSQPMLSFFTKGLASYFKAETTFTFHFSILTLSNAFLGIDNREMKSESGFSFAIASQPLHWKYVFQMEIQ